MYRLPVAVAFLLLIAGPAGAWPIYVAVANPPGQNLLQIDRDGTVTDVTVEGTPARELVVASDGNLIAGLLDGRVVKWDLASRTSTELASGFGRIEGLEPDGDVIYISDAFAGVFRLDSSGVVTPLFEDPAPSAAIYRYEGATIMREGPFQGSLFVGRRPLACRAFPQALMRFDDPRSASPSLTLDDIPHFLLDLVSRGDELVTTDWDCGGTEDLVVVDPVTLVTRRTPYYPYLGAVWKLGVDEEGMVVRASRGLASGLRALVIDRVNPETGDREYVLGLYGTLWSMAVDGRPALARLGCLDDPKNHGAYVSCVAHRTKELVRAGEMNDAARALLIQEAAQSEVGK